MNRLKRWVREFHDPRFYMLSAIMWFGPIFVGVASAWETGHWLKLIPFVLACVAAMALSLLGVYKSWPEVE